jgi:hypothetical protein
LANYKLTQLVNTKFKIINFKLMLLFILAPCFVNAQSSVLEEDRVSPRGAFLRSLAVPGWGHYYVDNDHWKRGQYHLAADVIMVLTYAGINWKTDQLESNLLTFAQSNANIDLSERGRDYFLAIANFDNLEAYNDYQLRARNWDDLYEDVPANRWNWSDDEERFRYQDMRERIDRNKNQLPALLTLMVANRIVSGVSAFVSARNKNIELPETRFSYLNDFGEPGFNASIRFKLD